jgi:hypothetical protein
VSVWTFLLNSRILNKPLLKAASGPLMLLKKGFRRNPGNALANRRRETALAVFECFWKILKLLLIEAFKRNFNSLLFTYLDRPRPEYEPLLVL